MARTLIGQLILRLQSQGLGEADKVRRAMKDVEASAARLAKAPAPAWGVGFQKSLNQLRLTQTELRAIETSWLDLHRSIKNQKLSDALANNKIDAWKTTTLGNVAAVKSGMAADFAMIEKRTREHARRLNEYMKPVFVGLGFYTAAYGAGMAGAGALKASAERMRTEYRLDLASIPESDQSAMREKALGLSGKYPSIDATEILELQKVTYSLFGGDLDKSLALIEPLVKSFIADVTAVGVQKAGENMSSFLKAMDNLNVNEGADGGVPNIEAILEGWTRAKQIEGREIDIGDLLGFARRAKVAKYGLSDDFLTYYLPSLGQDTGFDALGDALSGAYQNFVTPSGGGVQGQYVKRQKAMGLRDKNNSLVGRDLFASNPYQWTLEVLEPLLAKSGVDTANTAAVSEAVKKLMSNSKAAAAITGWIEAQNVIEKQVGLYKQAVGTADVENARFKDPFAATEALMAAFRNLSAALLPMEAIASGLNTLADGINSLAAAAEENPVLTALGIGAAGTAAYKGTKFVAGKAADMFGLKGSAVALNGSAAALTRAAVALGGKGALPTAAKVGGAAATGAAATASTASRWLRFGGGLATGAALGYFAGLAKVLETTFSTEAQILGYENMKDPETAERFNPAKPINVLGEAENRITGDPYGEAKTQATTAGDEIKNALSVDAKPNVDATLIDLALQKAKQLRAVLQGISADAAAANADLGAELRRNFAD
jgi:hypothetical protein